MFPRGNTSKKAAYIGVLTGLAVCLSLLERLIPLSSPVPGVKLGLGNVAVLVTLYSFGGGAAFFVTAVRVLLTGAMYGGLSGIMYGAAGGFLSCLIMLLLKRTNRPTVIGVSMAGGVFHNAGQIFVAAMIVDNWGMMYYLPGLILSGTAAGAVTGFCARLLLINLKRLSTTKP